MDLGSLAKDDLFSLMGKLALPMLFDLGIELFWLSFNTLLSALSSTSNFILKSSMFFLLSIN